MITNQNICVDFSMTQKLMGTFLRWLRPQPKLEVGSKSVSKSSSAVSCSIWLWWPTAHTSLWQAGSKPINWSLHLDSIFQGVHNDGCGVFVGAVSEQVVLCMLLQIEELMTEGTLKAPQFNVHAECMTRQVRGTCEDTSAGRTPKRPLQQTKPTINHRQNLLVLN